MAKSICLFVGISAFLLCFSIFVNSYAQNATQNATTGIHRFHTDVDISPIEAVIMINEDQNKNVSYVPSVTTIRVGGEILIANNATSDHSVTSGTGLEDQMSGKLFNTDIIKPGAFVEYIPVNLKPGNYSFYSSSNPDIEGTLVVVPPN